MSIEAGYDFESSELVTAQKLTRWLVGAEVSSPVAAAGAGLSIDNLSTGPTTVSLTEGVLFYNSSTGNIEVQSRWGHVPVLGGSQMHTRRFTNYFDGVENDEQRFYGPVQLGVEPNLTTWSCADDVMEEDWWNYAPARWGGISQQGNYGGVHLGALHPTIDNAGAQATEASWSADFHRCVLLRGWGPMIYSAVSQYTSIRVEWDYRSMKGATGYEQGPPLWGNATASRPGGVFEYTYNDWAGKYMLYLEPCLPTISYTKGLQFKNTRV